MSYKNETDMALLEKRAFNNYEMPDNLTLAEQMLFITLRCLYQSHTYGFIDAEHAKREKMRIIQQYNFYKFHSDIYFDTAEMRNRLSYHVAEISKNGCEHCKKAVAIFTDMDDEKLIDM